MTLGGLALGVIAIFLPPLPVLWRTGCSAFFLISIGLMFLGWIPAIVFAWFVILDKPSLRQRAARRRKLRRTVSVESYERTPPRSPSFRSDHGHDSPPPYPKDPYYGQESGYAPAPRRDRY